MKASLMAATLPSFRVASSTDPQRRRPNQRWIAEGRLCVAAVIDIFLRCVVGWSMRAEMTARAALRRTEAAASGYFVNLLAGPSLNKVVHTT
jgi:transposase InsO family protein